MRATTAYSPTGNFKARNMFGVVIVITLMISFTLNYNFRAGVGRTGTFIAIEGCLRQMENDNQVDIFGTVLRMRMQRNFMVQTEVKSIIILLIIDCCRACLAIACGPVSVWLNLYLSAHLVFCTYS